MSGELDINTLVDLIGTFGTNFIFLWLFVREMNSHNETRQQYRADLRDVAGLRESRLPTLASAMSRDEAIPHFDAQ